MNKARVGASSLPEPKKVSKERSLGPRNTGTKPPRHKSLYRLPGYTVSTVSRAECTGNSRR